MNKIYTTVQGDTWDVIAYRLWGKETMQHHLAQANPEYIDVLVFGPDVQLRVPSVAAPAKTLDLPPWMQSAGGGV